MNHETVIQNDIKVQLSKMGFIIFRNNVGGWKDPKTGRLIKYGLCVGSSDIIGLKPTLITQEHVGKILAIFSAFETKTEEGKLSPEQIQFLDMVKKNGGIACVSRSENSLKKLLY